MRIAAVSKSPPHIFSVARILRHRYGDFAHYNLEDPLDELLFIICSQKTAQSSYRRSFQALREEFPTYRALASASQSHIENVIGHAGLGKRKSKAIRALLRAIIDQFGTIDLNSLREVCDPEVEAVLVSLPGVGKKIARCVMMYSLGRKVFPVDTHCWRIARRLGWVRRTRFDGRCSPRDMDRLQNKVPENLRYSLHVNFISLGRELCRAASPKCDLCPISFCCKRIGVD